MNPNAHLCDFLQVVGAQISALLKCFVAYNSVSADPFSSLSHVERGIGKVTRTAFQEAVDLLVIKISITIGLSHGSLIVSHCGR